MESLNLNTKHMMAFVPSGKDFNQAIEFYRDLGFSILWQSEELAVVGINELRFYLQNFENNELQANYMMNLEVENVDDWWTHISKLNLKEKYPGIQLKSPTNYYWGKREIHLIDPAGVLWHIATDIK